MIYRILLILTITLTAIACTPQGPSQDELWEAAERCGGNERCTFAHLLTNQLNKMMAGKSFGHGVSVRGAQTDGKRVSVGVNVPEEIKTIATTSVAQELADDLRKNVCRKKSTRRFFDVGGELELSIYLPNGAFFSKSTLSAC